MSNKWTIQLSAVLLSACLWGTSVRATAQTTQAQTPSEEAPIDPAASNMTAQATTTGPTYQPTSYDGYQPTTYQPSQTTTGGKSETKRWPNRPLMISSAFMFTAAYVPAVIATAANHHDTTDNVYIPVAGPWMELAREPASSGNKALLALSGVFQDLGALGMLLSVFVPERKTSSWYLIGNKRLSAAPAAGPNSYGLSARGQF